MSIVNITIIMISRFGGQSFSEKIIYCTVSVNVSIAIFVNGNLYGNYIYFKN